MLIKSRVLEDISSKRYTIKFAKTEEEVNAALKLRYEVFKKELNRGFDFDKNKDKDEYDDQAHHLIVVNNDTGRVIGTYRMQTYEQALEGNGFVSNNRFYLDQFPDEVLKSAVEVGRACVHKDHRNGRILFLLWKGFAGYLTHFDKRYLFGYAAFETTDPAVLWNSYQHLLEINKIHPEYDIEVRDEYKLPEKSEQGNSDEIDIPPLLKNYLDVGCYVCGKPSLDKNQLAHALILLDVESISDRTRKLFFGK